MTNRNPLPHHEERRCARVREAARAGPRSRSRLAAVLALGAALAVTLPLGGCDSYADGGQYEIEQVRRREQPRREYAWEGSDAQRFRMVRRSRTPGHGTSMGGGMGGAAARSNAPFAWDLPPGWTEKASTSMRLGDFAIAGRPAIDCYLSALPGGGGGVAANINRWRKQMDQPAYSDDELNRAAPLRVLGEDGVFVAFQGNYRGMRGDLDNPDSKLAGVIVEYLGTAVFMKMVGPAADVDAEIENLKSLCASLRPAPATARDPHGGGTSGEGTSTGGVFDPAALMWDVPDGWQKAAPRQMRVVTFIPSAAPGHEIYVAMAGGGVAANVNRWLGQVGQPPLSAAAIEQLPTIDVLGRPSIIVEAQGEYTGMDGQTQNGRQALIGVVCDLGATKLFVKMTGPADAVLAERERFEQFCGSLR